MRNSLRLMGALGGAAIFGAALLLACSDDTNVSPTTEAGTDAKGDSPQADTSTVDGGPDTSPPFDGGFVVETFDNVLADELCRSLARCCYGNPNPPDGGVDGGSFDVSACRATALKVGFQGSNLGTGALRDGGNVTLDQVKADDCVNKIKALKCDLPGPEYAAARSACFMAYAGKLGASQACMGAVECQPGFFCKGQLDGGPGVCTSVRPPGGACGDNPDSPTEYEEACSYRGSGANGQYCLWTNVTTGVDLAPADWKCSAANGVDAGCATGTWCKDSVCDPNKAVCTSPERLFDNQCAQFIK